MNAPVSLDPLVLSALASPAEPITPVLREFLESHIGALVSGIPADHIPHAGDPFEREAEDVARRLWTSPVSSTRPDLSGVSVHTGPLAARSARALRARAYAIGDHIVFASPDYSAELLAHEVVHVLQQRISGVQAIQKAETDTAEDPAALATLLDSAAAVDRWVNQALRNARAKFLPGSGSWRAGNIDLSIDFVKKQGTLKYPGKYSVMAPMVLPVGLEAAALVTADSFSAQVVCDHTYCGELKGRQLADKSVELKYEPRPGHALTDLAGLLQDKFFTPLSSGGASLATQPQIAATMMHSVFVELGAAQSTQRGFRCLQDGWTKSPIEDWVLDLPPNHIHFVNESNSKYNGLEFRLWAAPRHLTRIIAPSMKVGGILIGSDKLGHFFEEGYIYYLQAQGAGAEEGRRRAEEWGEASERGKYGLIHEEKRDLRFSNFHPRCPRRGTGETNSIFQTQQGTNCTRP
jgi:hypothetical protein